MGINYNPCVISTSARGADATAAGVNIQPNVRTVGIALHLACLSSRTASPACLPESLARFLPERARFARAPGCDLCTALKGCLPGMQVIEVIAEGASGAYKQIMCCIFSCVATPQMYL